MLPCRNKFVNKIFWFNNINQLIVNIKTADVVKKRPIAAVAVSRDMFIRRTDLLNINYRLDLSLYQKILL